MDIVTLALAKKYARQVGSTIQSITPTDTGLHFVTSTGEFDVNIEGWSAVTDYLDLSNKPSINNIELVGNKTLAQLGVSQVGKTGEYNDLINKPIIPIKTSELINDSSFITNTVDNLINYYNKAEIFTKQEVQDLIRTVSGLQMKVVTQLPTIDIDTNTIYLLKIEGSNSYEQWIYSNNQWFKLGTTDVSLVDYYTKVEIDSKFVQKEIGKQLSTNDFTNEEKNKLDGIENGANKYVLPIASTTVLGGVKVDNDTITINTDGMIVAKPSESTNDYNDLINKPKIENVIIQGELTAKNLGLATEIYVKEQIDTAVFAVLGGAY